MPIVNKYLDYLFDVTNAIGFNINLTYITNFAKSAKNIPVSSAILSKKLIKRKNSS